MEENNINSWLVYMHTNKINNKKYIGITSNKPEYRWNYGKGYKYNNHFWNAIQKYGWDNFEHEIIISNLSHDEACEYEKKLIAYYKSNNPSYGYNNTTGGDANFQLSDEAKQKISEANKGEKNANYGVSPKQRMDEDTYMRWLYKQQHNKPKGSAHPQYNISPKERMDEETYNTWLYKQQHNKPKGESHSQYGVSPKERMDEETYRQWLEKRKDSPKNIAVRCIETDITYKSAREAERETKISHSAILNSCKSKDYSITAGGFHWCYGDDDTTMQDLGINYKGKRYIRCVETNKLYQTAREIKRELGCDDSSINKCCKGQIKTVHELHWEYVYLFPEQYEAWHGIYQENIILTIQN